MHSLLSGTRNYQLAHEKNEAIKRARQWYEHLECAHSKIVCTKIRVYTVHITVDLSGRMQINVNNFSAPPTHCIQYRIPNWLAHYFPQKDTHGMN